METNVKLMTVFGKLSSTFMDILGKNLDELGLAGSSYLILAHLNQVGRAKTQQIGQVAVITSGTITHMVNKLVKKGYVNKIQDHEDKRVFWVEITSQGRSVFNRVDKEHMKFLEHILEDFTEEEKETFIQQLKYFGKKIEKKMQ